MPNQFEKLTDEIKEKLAAHFASKENQEVVAKMKSDTADNGTFEFIISTEDVDRQGEIVIQSGWDLTHYKNNPIVLFAHDYYSLPIGCADEVYVDGKKLIAKGRFASAEANPVAQQCRKLYDEKILRTTSVGFIPREMDGNKITKAELLEFSLVPVPANPNALSLAKEMGWDVPELIKKGIFSEVVKDGEPVETVEPEPPQEIEEEVKEPIVEEKGVVADVLNAREAQTWDDVDKKYSHVEDLGEIFSAFATAFLDVRTPVANFATLANEMITLMQTYVANPETENEGGEMDAMKSFEFAKLLLKRSSNVTKKSGKVLSGKNSDIINEAIAQMQNATVALQELLKATEGGDAQDAEKSVVPEITVETAKSNDMDAFKKWFEHREILRIVNNATSEALRKYNTQSKSKK